MEEQKKKHSYKSKEAYIEVPLASIKRDIGDIPSIQQIPLRFLPNAEIYVMIDLSTIVVSRPWHFIYSKVCLCVPLKIPYPKQLQCGYEIGNTFGNKP